MLKNLKESKNLRVLFFIFFLFSILSIKSVANANSEVKEIQTIEDYSKQFLDEGFVLEDLKKEEEAKKTQEENEKKIKELAVEDKKIFSEDSVEGNIKELSLDSNKIFPIEIIDDLTKENKETIEDIIVEKKESKIENKNEIKIENEKVKKNFKKKEKNINWELEDNFRACLIGDLNGNVYFSKNADRPYPLASVTKIMTLLVTFDAINAKKISLNSRVRISENAAKQGGSKIRLRAGQIYKLKDLIKASAIYSANNATYAIAEFVGKGSLNRFVGLMNKKVRRLGLQKDLKYYTPAGLPTRMTKQPMDAGTARAIYKLSIEALKYKKYIQIAGIKKTTIRNGKIKLRNRNHLLGKHGVYGIKTGYHKEAKYNITVASKIRNKRVIVVVLGGRTYKTRDKTVLDILDIFEENYDILTKKNKK